MSITYHDFMIYFIMLVSNNSLLNILLPNENKVLKDVLKEADAKTLNSMKSGNTTVGDVLKNLFSDLKEGDKSKSTIENLLKNSNLFKDLGSFSKSVSSLIDDIDQNSDLSKYKTQLENFQKDVSTLDNKGLKDLISKSGVFLESKALNQLNTTSNLPKNLETILEQIKTTLKEIPSIDAKKIENLIDKIMQNNSKSTTGTANLSQSSNLQNNSDLKSLVELLQNLSKNVGDKQLGNLTLLTNNLKNISTQAQLVESKLTNQTNTQGVIQAKESLGTNAQTTLQDLKSALLENKNIPNIQTVIKQIDTLLQSNDLFSKNQSLVEPKNLLSQLTNLNEMKSVSAQNSNVSSLLTNLKNQIETISGLENKVLQNQSVQTEKTLLTKDINQTLGNLRNELLNVKNIDTKMANQIIDKMLNVQNLFTKVEIPIDLKNLQQNILNQTTNLNNFQSNFSSNINTLLLTLKENINNLAGTQTNLSSQQNIIKTVEKLETIVNNFIQNSSQQDRISQQNNPLQNDMKTVLLQMQEELSGKTDIKSSDTLKQVEKMLTQVEYYQLLSLTSNSNSVYVPFIWDMLDDGSISMKKIDEEKFYCEINLSLKEFGQTRLLLALYDKNKLDLTIYASNENFKESVKENIVKLKQALNSVDLIPVNIKIIDLKKEEEKPKEELQTDVYKQNSNLGFGIDIKA